MNHYVKSKLMLIFVLISTFALPVFSQERPLIWVQPNDRAQLVEKITQNKWAQSRFAKLRDSANKAAPKTLTERAQRVKKLPLHWQKNDTQFPDFIKQKNIGNNELRHPLQLGLQDAIDCGILYYLTEEEKYAHCAADILHTVVQGLTHTEIVKIKPKNQGWIIPDNHLLESRIFAAQIPIIYDFIYSYIKKGGLVYDPYEKKLVQFDFNSAQNVFTTYVELALNTGLINNNWPVLESPSLVHNLLAIDDKKKRAHYLKFYLDTDTKHQDSLAKVAQHYKNVGDVWPESLNYSIHVAYNSLYLMTLLDKLYPDLKLGNKYPNIGQAFIAYDQLRFPNGDYPAFGDGDRRFAVNYFKYELAYTSALVNNNLPLATIFADKISQAIKAGNYKRHAISGQTKKAKAYLSPLELLWTKANLTPDKTATKQRFTVYPTAHLPFAGFFVQRNLNTQNPIKNGLMATTGGGSYVHGHASGIDLELYGKGHVLGVEAGKGSYISDVHQHYNRLFAGHNTVISNGASASKGGWIKLGINTVTKKAMEPLPRTPAISDNYSFVTNTFFDEHNRIAPAQHERTTAIIRLNETAGFYVDIFKAKTDTQEPYHDYLYRNIADTLTVKSGKKTAVFKDDDNRYPEPKVMDRGKKSARIYGHPGWHHLKKVETAPSTNQALTATFSAKHLDAHAIIMKAHVVKGLEVEFTQARAPKSKIEAKPYNNKTLPMMVLRHKGNTWDNPFAVIYEPLEKKDRSNIVSVTRIMDNHLFKGLHITSKIKGELTQHIVLIQDTPNTEYINKQLNIKFTGHFGIIKITNKKLEELYIGDGQSITYKDKTLSIIDNVNSHHKTHAFKQYSLMAYKDINL